ncbi:hypothetical protein [Paludibaculum fermentans]|uniref:hypothetical protein n=1 Tax=Paludibaculum fermentans TaxID=1473598 RepID=UPI003EBE248D
MHRLKFGMAILMGVVALLAWPSGAQTSKPAGQWSGTIKATITATDTGFSSLGTMDCNLSGTSARCTYTSTTKASGKTSYVITESATQDHLQVSILPGASEWKLRVAAFISRGTKTITANGKSLSGGDVNIQAPNWEVPIAAPKDPNKLFGSWKNPLGDTIQWELSR